MGFCSPGQAGCLQFLPSWVLSASLNTQSCGQASLMATDYCFLKFICVRKSFKKHFPRLSLGAPAHQTKPPIWFSTAVNFAGLVSTRLQGGKQQLRSVQFSILCLAASCQDLAWFAEPSLFEVLFFSFFFLALQMLSGAPEVENQVCQTERSDKGYRCYRREANCHHQTRKLWTGCGGGDLGSWCCCWSRDTWEEWQLLNSAAAVSEQGWPQERGTNGSCPRGEHPQLLLVLGQKLEPKPVDVGGRIHVALVVVESSPTCTVHVGRGTMFNS